MNTNIKTVKMLLGHHPQVRSALYGQTGRKPMMRMTSKIAITQVNISISFDGVE
jgi:hypothetical protein